MLDSMHRLLDFMSTALGLLVVTIAWLIVIGLIVVAIDFVIGAVLDRNPEEDEE